jgi:hypothetical protein
MIETIAKITLQEYADKVVAGEYRQPLKTVQEAVAAAGWEWADKPVCCGTQIEVRSFIGSAYMGECMACGRFIVDVSGPTFGNSWVNFPDSTKIELSVEQRWIAGQRTKIGK